METQLLDINGVKILECLPGGGVIASENDALDVVAACGENETDRVLLNASNLAMDFLHLRTGLAGAVLLKFSNYRIRAAAVLTPKLVNQGHFREMVMETNRGNVFRVFYDRDLALKWLGSLEVQS
jgi:PadR family transcriptional regulator, regulatory protein AphA